MRSTSLPPSRGGGGRGADGRPARSVASWLLVWLLVWLISLVAYVIVGLRDAMLFYLVWFGSAA